MSADLLPERPNLDQLKRQAKELLKSWKMSPPPLGVSEPRLRDAQHAIAERYGFASWHALREHLQGATRSTPRRGLLYDDPIPNATFLTGAVTRDIARRLARDHVAGIKIDGSVPAETLKYLADVPTLTRLDFSGCGALHDEHVAFVRAMPQLVAVNLRWTSTGDGAVAALTGKSRLSRVIFGSRLTDAGVERLREFPVLVEEGDSDSMLSISGGRTLTDRALEVISELKGLAALDVHTSVFGSPHYTARGVAHLKKLPSLDSLNFHGRLATDDVLREIAAIPRLRWLHCQDIVSGDDGFIALGKTSTLETLAARFCSRITNRGFEAIARLPRLTALSLGGPHLGEDAVAPLAESRTLVDLNPILSRDGAFVHIAKIATLERLTNMYNRATTDAATRHLANHRALRDYSAFGTQITDDSLRILATIPHLHTVAIDNCAGVTDDGLRALLQAPKLQRVSALACIRVTGAWTASARPGTETRSDQGPRDYAEFYLAETLMDHPDLPASDDLTPPSGDASGNPALPPLACFVERSSFTVEGLRIAASSERAAQRVGVITREAFAVPMRIDIVVRPLTELRIVFGAHNQHFAFDDRGRFVDLAPWFLKVDAEKGTAHGEGVPIADDEWTRVTLENDARERRVFVNGELRHSWRGDYSELRSRVAVGLRRSALTMRELRIE